MTMVFIDTNQTDFCWFHFHKLYKFIFPGVSKKLEKAAKKKDAEQIRPRIKSITNHMYWVAGTSGADPDLKEQKWLSILNHIVDKHDGHGTLFYQCVHQELREPRAWLNNGRFTNFKIFLTHFRSANMPISTKNCISCTGIKKHHGQD